MAGRRRSDRALRAKPPSPGRPGAAGRDATIDAGAVVEAALGAVPVVRSREEIALWRAQGHGVREIARRLGRAPSTVSRELRRHAAPRGGGLEYRATTAQWHAERAAPPPEAAELAT